jgi:hypothetical protein
MIENILQKEIVQLGIKKLIEYAEANVYSLAVMKELHKKSMDDESVESIGDDLNHCLFLPLGYKIVYSMEEQPFGLCRHISISQGGLIPQTQDIFEIMNHFGFKSNAIGGSSHTYSETYHKDGTQHYAINIIEKI